MCGYMARSSQGGMPFEKLIGTTIHIGDLELNATSVAPAGYP